MHQTYLEILRILSGAWKQRYVGLAAAWLVAVAGVVFVAMQKDVYEASATSRVIKIRHVACTI